MSRRVRKTIFFATPTSSAHARLRPLRGRTLCGDRAVRGTHPRVAPRGVGAPPRVRSPPIAPSRCRRGCADALDGGQALARPPRRRVPPRRVRSALRRPPRPQRPRVRGAAAAPRRRPARAPRPVARAPHAARRRQRGGRPLHVVPLCGPEHLLRALGRDAGSRGRPAGERPPHGRRHGAPRRRRRPPFIDRRRHVPLRRPADLLRASGHLARLRAARRDALSPRERRRRLRIRRRPRRPRRRSAARREGAMGHVRDVRGPSRARTVHAASGAADVAGPAAREVAEAPPTTSSTRTTTPSPAVAPSELPSRGASRRRSTSQAERGDERGLVT